MAISFLIEIKFKLRNTLHQKLIKRLLERIITTIKEDSPLSFLSFPAKYNINLKSEAVNIVWKNNADFSVN